MPLRLMNHHGLGLDSAQIVGGTIRNGLPVRHRPLLVSPGLLLLFLFFAHDSLPYRPSFIDSSPVRRHLNLGLLLASSVGSSALPRVHWLTPGFEDKRIDWGLALFTARPHHHSPDLESLPNNTLRCQHTMKALAGVSQ